jgi:hypothetical protein
MLLTIYWSTISAYMQVQNEINAYNFELRDCPSDIREVGNLGVLGLLVDNCRPVHKCPTHLINPFHTRDGEEMKFCEGENLPWNPI